jgi:hypothetical protein
VGAVEVLERWCGGCRDETVFEVPPCEDDHGHDCPDLACVVCGLAVVMGVMAPGVKVPGAAVLEVRAA